MKTLREYIDIINTLQEGGVTLPNPDGTMPPGAFTAQDQMKLNQQVGQKQAGGAAAQPAGPTADGEEDIGNGFVKLQTEIAGRKVPAIKDTQSGSIIARNFDPATGGAIFRSIARYIVDGKLTMQLGPDTQAAADKALGK
jgi:hypothetical protein